MGYVTTISFLNDSKDYILKYPVDVLTNILDAMRNETTSIKKYSIGNNHFPMMASKTAHADDSRLYVCRGNTIIELGGKDYNSNIEFKRKCLNEAKRLIKEEEDEIAKMEAVKEIDSSDLFCNTSDPKVFGDYVVYRHFNGNKDAILKYGVNDVIFIGDTEEVVKFINEHVNKGINEDKSRE